MHRFRVVHQEKRMSRSNSNQDGAQRDRMLLEITMKKRKPFLFLIQTGVCLAIAAVVLRVGSSLFDNVPAEAHAGPKTNARFVQPELKSFHTLPPAFRIWHMANSNAPADAENTE